MMAAQLWMYVAACVCLALSSLAAAQDAVASTPSPSSSPPTPEAAKDTATTPKKVTDLKVKVLLEDPFVMRKVVGGAAGGGNEDYEGILIDVLKEVMRRSNLTYSISVQGDQQFGHEYAPGNWTGLIGSVQEGKAHLAVGPLSIMSKRQDVVDFSLPVMSAGLRILYKKPEGHSQGESLGVLLSPFTPGLWVLLLLTFVGVSLMFYVLGRFSPYEDVAFVGKTATYEGLTLVNSLLYAFTSMTFQGYTAAPRSLSGRVLAAFWWMLVLLVITSYTASLCAIFLAFKPAVFSTPFATFSELSKQTSVAFGIIKGGSTQWYLSNSNRSVEKNLWSRIEKHGDNWMANSVRQGVMRVQASKGDFAFIMEGPMAEFYAGKKPCNLMVLGEELGTHAYGFACQKNTDVCSNINVAILELHEEEFIFQVMQKWMRKECKREDIDTSEYLFQGLAYFDTFGDESSGYLADRSVTLRRFSTGFLLLLVGLILSGALLLGEMFYAKRRGTAVPQRMPRAAAVDDQDTEYRDEA